MKWKWILCGWSLFGDFGYEAGRCKSLVPSAAGKRREERGKYLVLLNRQATGEWKILADSWSSDLSLAGAVESPKTGVGLGNLVAGPPRKPRRIPFVRIGPHRPDSATICQTWP